MVVVAEVQCSADWPIYHRGQVIWIQNCDHESSSECEGVYTFGKVQCVFTGFGLSVCWSDGIYVLMNSPFFIIHLKINRYEGISHAEGETLKQTQSLRADLSSLVCVKTLGSQG